MSRYIRTKDGVYDTTKIATGSKYMNFATNDESFREIFKTEPLAKSENLEELCDEFVFVSDLTKYIIDKDTIEEVKKITLATLKTNYAKYNPKIYGAIWTDEGLIYVAKMNDKGDLELI